MIDRLVHILRALAASPDAQLAASPELVTRAGEIAGDFSDSVRLVIDCPQIRLDPVQRIALDRVEQFLDARGDRDRAAFWTEAAIRSSEEWTILRQLAREALERLRVPANAIRRSRSD